MFFTPPKSIKNIHFHKKQIKKIPFYLFHEPKIKPSISQKPQKVKDLVITVRPSDGKDLQVDSLNSQSLIADLTNLISGKFCVNNNDIRIVSKGKILELNKTLRFYEVKNGDLVQAMFTQVPQTQQMTQNQETK